MPSDRATRTSPESAAVNAGLRCTPRPRAANRAFCGSCCHDFDGQKTFGPISDTTAGISVRPAIRVTVTEMASAGPICLRKPSVDSTSARNAMMTAPAAEAMASPTLATALIMACFGSSPARRRSLYRNIRNRK